MQAQRANKQAILFVFFSIILFVFLLSSHVFAQQAKETPESIIKKMDATISGYDDQQMDVTMTIIDTDNSEKSYDFTIWQRGEEKRLIRFETGEMRGMSMLVESRNRVFVYLPGYKRVRRVAASNMGQTMAGSDFTNDDMASIRWSEGFDLEMVKQDDAYWFIKCTPKPDQTFAYGHAVVKVDKSNYNQAAVEYYNENGELVKVMTVSNYREFPGGVKRGDTIMMTDAASGHKTVLKIRDFKVNQGLRKSMFTVRELMWKR